MTIAEGEGETKMANIYGTSGADTRNGGSAADIIYGYAEAGGQDRTLATTRSMAEAAMTRYSAMAATIY
jgi:hypothetical protein